MESIKISVFKSAYNTEEKHCNAVIESILNQIFSITNTFTHRTITILGIKFSTKLKDLKLMRDVLDNEFLIYQQKHKAVIEKLREEVKHRKLRVCFLVAETSKWNSQNLYDEMEKSDIFEPFVLVSNLKLNKFYQPYDEIVQYFKNLCSNVEIGYDVETKKSIDLKNFSPDIIFYQQWCSWENQGINYASEFALPYHFSYAIGEAVHCLKSKMFDFYIALHKYFILSKAEEIQYEKELNYKCKNMVVTGHPKLDTYKDYCEENYEHKYVIYAPHHSFEKVSLHYATFDWNGKYILDWAKAHPEFEWVFKPHPRLKKALITNNIMTEAEVENYYSEWRKIGKVCEDGSYFDLFKNSKCLITDCGAFLLEYLPTRQPVIHLRNPKGTDYIESIKEAMKSYYTIWNKKELEESLQTVLIKENDYKKQERISVLEKLDIQNNSTEKIISEIKKDIE